LPGQRARTITRCARTAFNLAQAIAYEPVETNTDAPIITAL
jgi:hypothetical protein